MTKREFIEEQLEMMEESALTMDGFDDAIIGLTETGTDKPKVVYSRQKCLDILVAGFAKREDETEEDVWTQAVEFFDYNTVRACDYMGVDAPIIVNDCEF